jgi:trehalose 6-phosphate synthase
MNADESKRLHESNLDYLAGRHVIIGSNRGPVTFYRDENGERRFQRGSGGLITALTGLIQYVDATWIACSQTEDDREWGQGSLSLFDDTKDIQVKFLSPDPIAYEGYYNVISNPLLWFLQHSMWDVPRQPIIDYHTWEAWKNGYVEINRQFAAKIVEETKAAQCPVLVMIQDYHLYLAARFIRQALNPDERPTILFFVHIPWPGPEYWSILPPAMRQAILDGLCATDLLGFQTREDGLNFIRTCESHLPRAYTNYKHGRIWYRNHATYIRDFPISIDVESLRYQSKTLEVLKKKQEIQELVGDCQVILRIDRIEPSKNITRGFKAFEELLERYPEHRSQVKFLALLVPSRMNVEEYQEYLDEIMAVVGQITAEYGSSGWEPVRLLIGEDYARAIAALQIYDVLLVNAVADGMNLVAKEGPIVNLRNGVIVLSERAGAYQQLAPGAIVVSPCDVYATAEALHQALIMGRDEKKEWAELLQKLIEENDINHWLYSQLEAVRNLKL